MNKLLLTVAFSAVLGASTYAQDMKTQARTPADRAKQMTERMTQQLALTADEVPKVQAINEKYTNEASELRQQRQADKANTDQTATQDSRSAAKELNNKKNEELKGVLTPEQYDNWMKMQQKMMERRQEMHQAKKADGTR